MKNVEKKLANYIKGTQSEPKEQELIEWINKDANELINILFRLLNNCVENINGDKDVKKELDLFKYLSAVIHNSDEVNRGIIIRKLTKLDEKISRLKEEKRNKFFNVKRAYTELEKMRAELYKAQLEVSDSNTSSYDFISYLITNTRNISYAEYILKKHPNLVNAKDANKESLLLNVLNKYIKTILEGNEKDSTYYENLVTIMLNSKNLNFTEQEKRKVIETIYKVINKISLNKKPMKTNQSKIEKLNLLINTLIGTNKDKKDKKIELIAQKYHINIYFSDTLLAEARLHKMPKIGEIEDRTEIDDYIITIDKPGTLHIDDGLSCVKLDNGNYLLGVHNATVLGYLPYESIIVQEALNRANVIHLPRKFTTKDNTEEKVISSLPYSFAVQTASLFPNKPKLARSYYFEIDKYGNVVNENYLKTIITSSKRTTFSEFDQILQKGSSDKKLDMLAENLQGVTNILDKIYQSDSLYAGIKESTTDCQGNRVKKQGAYNIVYKSMILVGHHVATHFAKEGYPCLYRVHETNHEDMKKIKEMIDSLTDFYGGEQYKNLYQIVEGIYPKGWYATSGRHDGLNLDHYCHCTSALTRGADIVVEHALEVCYDNRPTDNEVLLLAAEIEKQAAQINAKQSSIEYFLKECRGAYQKRRH
ncbi:MAG: RNB domain-containing ribonuclease [Bacilli bacterium]|nr:RNB domain-containing ribonuclease [Bacilli bacterium]